MATSLLIIFISSLFLMLPTNILSVSFNFNSFNPYQNYITLEGDAFIPSDSSIYLSKLTSNSSGRASYSTPIQLWDSKTGRLAWFTTTFSFIIGPSSESTSLLADGISFFLSPFSSSIPQNSYGGYLGLFNADNALNSYENQILAVEFDTFQNSWDPLAAPHIGIDINSIASVTTENFASSNVDNALTAYATVNYEPNAKNLSVVLTYPQSGSGVTTTTLEFEVDLRLLLPEWIRVGFSGATGGVVESHKILTWSFSSSFY